MKSITFKPLRRVKKTGQIVVANYLKWHEVAKADGRWCPEFLLMIKAEYQSFNPEELVFNHKGENLFFYDYSPSDIEETTTELFVENFGRAESNVKVGDLLFSCKGLDINGTPAFSHYTQNYIATNCRFPEDFEPLRVKHVVEWYGWFLLRKNKANVFSI